MSDKDKLTDLKSNWDTYENLGVKAAGEPAGALFKALGERIVMCPAFTKDGQPGAHPGGLVAHTLQVTATMRRLNKALEWDVPVGSILKVGLFHDLGKVGSLEHDYFVEQTSQWHREKLGQLYKYNEKLNKMAVSHRSLYLLQHFGIHLTNDEWLAIQLAQGSHFEENRFYVGHEPSLALLLQQSKQLTLHMDSKSLSV
jgi:hypothetical protein